MAAVVEVAPSSSDDDDDEEAIASLDLRGRNLLQLPDVPVSLLALRCSHNRLRSLPAALGAQLAALKALDVARNDLAALPALPGTLEVLAAAENGIEGFPTCPKSLRTLGLSHNAIAEIPPAIGELRLLTSLQLGGNRLITLPDALGELRSLRVLAVYDNDLTALPEAIGRLARLETLRCGGNCLVRFPEALARCGALREVAASGNRLEDVGPVAALVALARLWLGNNRLATFDGSALAALAVLDLERNPSLATFAAPPRAREVRLYACPRLSAFPSLPATLAALNVGGASALGALNASLFHLLALETLKAANAGLASLPASGWRALAVLAEMDLNDNSLVSLPDALGELASLRVLRVAGNALAELPASIGALPSLAVLRVERNRLASLPAFDRPLEELRCYANPHLRPRRWPACRIKWVDASSRPPEGPGATRAGRTFRGLPYDHLALGSVGKRHCIVSFGAMDFEWGGTIARAGLPDVAVCHLYDERQTSYAREGAALRRFLAGLAETYDAVSFLGSSRGAYGCLRYADLATGTILALSPLRADVRWRPDDADADEFPPAGTEVAARIIIHVGGRNRRDVAVAERIRRRHPDAALVLVRSADHGPDLYPRPRLDALVRSTFSPRS